MERTLVEKFSNCIHDLIDFESDHSVPEANDNIHSLEALRVELDSRWDQVKRSYMECRDYVSKEGQAVDKDKLRTRYKDGLASYRGCLGVLNEEIQRKKESSEQQKRERASTSKTNDPEREVTPISRLPPCDTDIFYGGYAKWPTFRDLFFILYGNNTRLSKVEKLFHLTQKTGGEARELISNVPLTHDGFEIAWGILTARYENKRMQ